jgi:glycerol kinase
MMRADANVKLRNLHADGGPTRNGFLMQFTADLTGVELKVSEVAESSAWGAAMNGLLALGVYRSLNEPAALPRAARSFRLRRKAVEEVQRLHDGWLAAVRRIL